MAESRVHFGPWPQIWDIDLAWKQLCPVRGVLSAGGSYKDTRILREHWPAKRAAKGKAAGREGCRGRQCVREEELSDEREAKREMSSHLELNRHTAVKLWSDT